MFRGAIRLLRVSIHALRTEGDRTWGKIRGASAVSIHALRTEGDFHKSENIIVIPVSIHALRTEGDLAAVALLRPDPVSIHALRTEGDSASRSWRNSSSGFNPRPPHGGRLIGRREKAPSG